MRARRDQHGVRDQRLLGAVRRPYGHPPGAVGRLVRLQPAAAAHHARARARDGRRDVVRLGQRQALHAPVHLAQVHADNTGHLLQRRRVVGDDDPELLVRGVEGRHHLSRRDESLRRHAVGQHRRPAQTVAVDDGHLRAELRAHQRRFVAAGSATNDHDPSHILHCPAPATRSPPGALRPGPHPSVPPQMPSRLTPVPSEPCRSTPRTPATSTRG